MERESPTRPKATLTKDSSGRNHSSWCVKAYYIVAVIKTVWYSQRKTYRWMEENRKSRNSSSQVCPTDFWQVYKEFTGGKIAFPTDGAGATVLKRKRKKEPQPRLHIFYKISSKCIIHLNVKCKIIKTFRKKLWENLQVKTLALGKEFFRLDIKSITHKGKNWHTRPHQNEKLLLCEVPCEEDEKTSYRVGENICKPHIGQRICI